MCVAAADSMRQNGYRGRILMLSEEDHLPYDRPVLSKNLVKAGKPEELALRSEEHFENWDIELRTGRQGVVTELDAAGKVVRVASGEEIKYDAALLATGARPRTLPIAGANLPGVIGLRNPEDAQSIGARCGRSSKVVVIGSSFIGMEIAATLQRLKCEVTVVGMEALPFERVLGKEIGKEMHSLFESRGVTMIGGSSVTEITRRGDAGLEVGLKGGKRLPCDAVVVGIGVVPNAKFVSGVEKAKDGSLITDACMKTSAPGLYAAGDVATFKSPKDGLHKRVEHWDVAMSQGRLAGKNMAGKQDEFDATPFFWTQLFGRVLRYIGHCTDYDELIVDGKIEKLKFVAYYCNKGEIKAVATMGRDPVSIAVGELMRQGKMPSAAVVRAPGFKSEVFVDEFRNGLGCAKR
eukprot:TRINITY_DN21972_c0_g1_i2.p1 TRINITY_DN21972_c0_g1~~TRINITY_DN21972_c0_g1_i2.p1  ORF type:complete len:407 (-),score=87.87 TRINITY_DN21972_c0_g1_i2:84-1304(-)